MPLGIQGRTGANDTIAFKQAFSQPTCSAHHMPSTYKRKKLLHVLEEPWQGSWRRGHLLRAAQAPGASGAPAGTVCASQQASHTAAAAQRSRPHDSGSSLLSLPTSLTYSVVCFLCIRPLHTLSWAPIKQQDDTKTLQPSAGRRHTPLHCPAQDLKCSCLPPPPSSSDLKFRSLQIQLP